MLLQTTFRCFVILLVSAWLPAQEQSGQRVVDPLMPRVIVIETTPDVERSEVLRKVIEALEKEGAAKQALEDRIGKPVGYLAQINARPDAPFESLQQFIKELRDAGIEKFALRASDEPKNSATVTTPADAPWRQVRRIEEVLAKHSQFAGRVLVAENNDPVTPTFPQPPVPTITTDGPVDPNAVPQNVFRPAPAEVAPASVVKVFALKNSHATTVARIIEQLFRPEVSVATEEKTNSLIVRGPDKRLQEIAALLTQIEAAVRPAPGGAPAETSPAGHGLKVHVPALGPTPLAIDFNDGASPSKVFSFHVGILRESADELRKRSQALELQSRELAEQLKGPFPNLSEAEKKKELLRSTVQQAFAARQALLGAENAELAKRLHSLQQTIEIRDRVSQQIIDRRIDDLLNPHKQWNAELPATTAHTYENISGEPPAGDDSKLLIRRSETAVKVEGQFDGNEEVLLVIGDPKTPTELKGKKELHWPVPVEKAGEYGFEVRREMLKLDGGGTAPGLVFQVQGLPNPSNESTSNVTVFGKYLQPDGKVVISPPRTRLLLKRKTDPMLVVVGEVEYPDASTLPVHLLIRRKAGTSSEVKTFQNVVPADAREPYVDHRNARSVVEAWVAAVIAEDARRAKSFAKDWPARADQIEAWGSGWKLRDFSIGTVKTDEESSPLFALVVSSKEVQVTRPLDGHPAAYFLGFKLKLIEGNWFITDVGPWSTVEAAVNHFLNRDADVLKRKGQIPLLEKPDDNSRQTNRDDVNLPLKNSATETPLDRRNARSVVEAYVAAALAGRVEQAAALARGAAKRRKEIESLSKQLNVQRLVIKSVYVNDPAKPVLALALSEAVTLPKKEFPKAVPVTVRLPLLMSEEGWLVIDIDFESDESAEEELTRFLEGHPKAVILSTDLAKKMGGLYGSRLAPQPTGKQLGTVLGKPIHESDLNKNTSTADNLKRLLLQPLTENYCRQHKLDRAEELKGKVTDERHRAMVRLFVLPAQLHRHLFEKHGGRVILSAFGPIPVDALKKWFEEREQAKDFELTDLDLKATYRELWMQAPANARFASPDQIKSAFDPALTDHFIETLLKNVATSIKTSRVFPVDTIKGHIASIKQRTGVAAAVEELRKLTGLDYGNGVDADSRQAWLDWWDDETSSIDSAKDGVREFVITGVVTATPNGKPIVGAIVQAHVPFKASASGEYQLATTRADLSGRYVLALGIPLFATPEESAWNVSFSAHHLPGYVADELSVPMKLQRQKGATTNTVTEQFQDTLEKNNDTIFAGVPIAKNFKVLPVVKPIRPSGSDANPKTEQPVPPKPQEKLPDDKANESQSDARSENGQTKIAIGKIQYSLPFSFPSVDAILSQMTEGKARPKHERIVCELVKYQVSDARHYPLVGPAQLVQAHFESTVTSEAGREVVYSDSSHLIRVPPE